MDLDCLSPVLPQLLQLQLGEMEVDMNKVVGPAPTPPTCTPTGYIDNWSPRATSADHTPVPVYSETQWSTVCYDECSSFPDQQYSHWLCQSQNDQERKGNWYTANKRRRTGTESEDLPTDLTRQKSRGTMKKKGPILRSSYEPPVKIADRMVSVLDTFSRQNSACAFFPPLFENGQTVHPNTGDICRSSDFPSGVDPNPVMLSDPMTWRKQVSVSSQTSFMSAASETEEEYEARTIAALAELVRRPTRPPPAHSNYVCNICHSKEHYISDCPQKGICGGGDVMSRYMGANISFGFYKCPNIGCTRKWTNQAVIPPGGVQCANCKGATIFPYKMLPLKEAVKRELMSAEDQAYIEREYMFSNSPSCM